MPDGIVRELERLLERQDEYVDDTFELLTTQYEAAVRDVADDLRGIVDQIETTTDDRLTADSVRVAQARLTAMRSMPAAAAVWDRWSSRLRRVADLAEDYFAVAGGVRAPSAQERSIVAELIGLWPDGENLGSGTAARYYQLSVHHRQELANAVTRQVLGRTRRAQLVQELVERTGKSSTQAEQLFRDSTIQFARSVQSSRAEEQDYEYFKYFGPVDSITRPFCAPLVGGIFSRDEIEQMDNGQTGTGSVMVAGGGYNCRHHWQPVRRSWFSDDEWEAAR